MALTQEMIQPAAPAASPLNSITPTALPGAPRPAAKTVAPKTKGKEKPVLPPEIQNNQVVKDVLQGVIPGVLVRPNIYYPKAYKIAENWQELMDLGLDFYWTKDESTILFNPAKISEQELITADKQGILTKVLPDYETLSGERPQKPPKGVQVGLGLNQPGGASPAPAAPPGVPNPGRIAPVPGVGPAPGGLDKKLATARVNNLNVAAAGPTTGPRPGAGRVLNATATPAV